MNITIYRYQDTGAATMGLMFIDGRFFCHILENPWMQNQRNLSCIPAGEYVLGLRKEGGFHRKYSEKFPDLHQGMIEVKDVPERDFILFHIGNSPNDTDGCILVGASSKKNFIGASTKTYERWYDRVIRYMQEGIDVHLSIKHMGVVQ